MVAIGLVLFLLQRAALIRCSHSSKRCFGIAAKCARQRIQRLSMAVKFCLAPKWSPFVYYSLCWVYIHCLAWQGWWWQQKLGTYHHPVCASTVQCGTPADTYYSYLCRLFCNSLTHKFNLSTKSYCDSVTLSTLIYSAHALLIPTLCTRAMAELVSDRNLTVQLWNEAPLDSRNPRLRRCCFFFVKAAALLSFLI